MDNKSMFYENQLIQHIQVAIMNTSKDIQAVFQIRWQFSQIRHNIWGKKLPGTKAPIL